MNHTKSIEIAAASVIGRNHRRSDRPCQDAFAVRRGEGVVVAAVCDGCGSGAHSELGARLGANLFASALVERLTTGAVEDAATWRGACDDVLARLHQLAPELGPSPVGDHLLFTLLAVAVTEGGAAVMAIGDGVVVIDGEARVLDAGEDNAPAYLGYELVGGTVHRELWVLDAPTRSVILASDGATALLDRAGEALPGGRGRVLDLGEVAGDDRLFRNPDALRRRLAVASQESVDVDWATGRMVRHGGVLTDDTTVVALRWGQP